MRRSSVRCRFHGTNWSKQCQECLAALDRLDERRGRTLRRLAWGVAAGYAALSVAETFAGAGAAVILIGEALKWWDLL